LARKSLRGGNGGGEGGEVALQGGGSKTTAKRREEGGFGCVGGVEGVGTHVGRVQRNGVGGQQVPIQKRETNNQKEIKKRKRSTTGKLIGREKKN